MRNVSSAFRQMLFQNKRKYNNTLLITLADGTEFTVTNANIMDGGIDIDDAVGDDSDFNALGSTVIRGCEVTLYNNNINYSDYDFINAKVIVKTNLVGANSSDELQLGVFTVDEPTYSDYSVSLSLLDNMCQFDRTYDSYSIYTSTTTLFDIVSDACTKCGVLYDSSMTQFPNHDFIIPNAPKEDCTYREVIGWCATLAGCFAKMTDEGKLKFDWFDIDAFDTDDSGTTDGGEFDSASPYATGDNVNGGTFNPWNDPSSLDAGTFAVRNNIYYIGGLNTQNIGTDDVVITGIQVTYDVETNNSNSTETQLEGTDDYIVSIEGNPFITADNYEDVLTFLNPILIGLQFRPCNITQPNDPTVEAGDVAYIWDTKGVQHRTLITRATFNPTSLQTIICGAKTPAHNSSNRLSAITKAIVKSRRQLNAEKSIRQQLESSFNTYVANAHGLYLSEIPDGGSVIIYGHDKPNLTDSKMVLKVSNGAISMTNDYRGTDADTSAANAWYGFQFDGTWLANIISTVSLFFNYAHGGTLKLGGTGNGNGQLIIYDENNNPIGTLNKDGAEITGILKMLGDTTFCTIGNSPTYVSYVVEGFTQRTLENLQYTIPYDSNGHVRATKTFVKADTGEIQEILALAGTRAKRFVITTTGSYLPELNTSSDLSKIRGYEETVSYNSTKGAIYELYPIVGGSGHDTGLEIYKNHVKLGKFTCDGEARIGANRELDLPGNSSSATIDGNTIAYVSSSSKRYKHNIKPLSDNRDAHRLLDLPIVEFEWNDGHNLQYRDMRGQIIPGIIAEDVAEIYPSAVIRDPNTNEIESWDERRIIPGMLSLIQEQHKKIKSLEDRIAKLEHLVGELTNVKTEI